MNCLSEEQARVLVNDVFSYLKQRSKKITSILKNIIVAYRTRLSLLYKRNQLLESIGFDFEKAIENKRFHPELRRIQQKEKGLLNIFSMKTDMDKEFEALGKPQFKLDANNIREDEQQLGYNTIDISHNILDLLGHMRFAREQIGKLGGISDQEFRVATFAITEKNISRKDFENMTDVIMAFLKQLEKDFKIIEERMTQEEYFLRAHEEKHFKAFIKSWIKEVKSNDELLKVMGACSTTLAQFINLNPIGFEQEEYLFERKLLENPQLLSTEKKLRVIITNVGNIGIICRGILYTINEFENKEKRLLQQNSDLLKKIILKDYLFGK